MRFFWLYFIAPIVFSVSILPRAEAQMINGSFSPNFTVTDIDGESHNLYDILDQGKTVIIDFFATWCGPCWDYHQNGHLENIWLEYGPSGSDELFVLSVEGYPFTDLDALEGIGTNTLGDFTYGVTYPIVNSHDLANLFKVSYWPTVYMICPDKRITEIGQVSPNSAKKHLKECGSPTGVNNAELMFFESNLDPFCQYEAYIPKVRFQNLGSNPITQASFDLLLNGEVEHSDCQWQGYLSPFASSSLEFVALELEESANISVRINAINGEVDNTPPNNKISGVKLTPKAFSKKVVLDIQTDNFGYEIYWELRDENGQAITSGGNDLVVPGGPQLPADLIDNPNGYYDSDATYQHEIQLPEYGCYEFYIIDDYGDGICCNYGDGSFRLSDEQGNVITEGGASFSTFTNCFEVTTGGTNALQDLAPTNPIEVFPNPAKDQLTIATAASAPTFLSIYNATGQMQRSPQQLQATDRQELDLSDFTPGLYFLQFQIGGERITRKIVVE